MPIIEAIGANVPLPDKPAARLARDAESTVRAAAADGVVISADALAAAERARFVIVGGQGDIRKELVAEAQADLERGAYRIQQVVVQVAQRLFPLVML